MAKTTFTLAEAADLLSCHKETLRRAIKDGTLRRPAWAGLPHLAQ